MIRKQPKAHVSTQYNSPPTLYSCCTLFLQCSLIAEISSLDSDEFGIVGPDSLWRQRDRSYEQHIVFTKTVNSSIGTVDAAVATVLSELVIRTFLF